MKISVHYSYIIPYLHQMSLTLQFKKKEEHKKQIFNLSKFPRDPSHLWVMGTHVENLSILILIKFYFQPPRWVDCWGPDCDRQVSAGQTELLWAKLTPAWAALLACVCESERSWLGWGWEFYAGTTLSANAEHCNWSGTIQSFSSSCKSHANVNVTLTFDWQILFQYEEEKRERNQWACEELRLRYRLKGQRNPHLFQEFI